MGESEALCYKIAHIGPTAYDLEDERGGSVGFITFYLAHNIAYNSHARVTEIGLFRRYERKYLQAQC